MRGSPGVPPTDGMDEAAIPSADPDRRRFLESALGLLVGAAVAPSTAAALTHSGPSRPAGSSPSGDPSAPNPSARKPSAGAASLDLFPGFESIRVETSEAVINGVRGGDGPPLLLLHGYPQSHLEWHHIAPRLAEHFTVVATDLRGYGDSSKPPGGDDHAGYSKRAMARDQVEVMAQLGFERFQLVGHDRGGRVAHRLTLDHPERVSRVAVLDIVPTHHIYTNVTKELATAYYHWFFLIQREPVPETLYGSNPDFVLRSTLFGGLVGNAIPDEVYAEYLRHFGDPATLHAMCEDYRAAAGIDLDHDEADMHVRIACPLLALWGASGAMERLYDVLAIWRERGTDVRGATVPGGHWFPEQRPDETFEALMAFLER